MAARPGSRRRAAKNHPMHFSHPRRTPPMRIALGTLPPRRRRLSRRRPLPPDDATAAIVHRPGSSGPSGRLVVQNGPNNSTGCRRAAAGQAAAAEAGAGRRAAERGVLHRGSAAVGDLRGAFHNSPGSPSCPSRPTGALARAPTPVPQTSTHAKHFRRRSVGVRRRRSRLVQSPGDGGLPPGWRGAPTIVTTTRSTA